jgi:hypothetical protein
MMSSSRGKSRAPPKRAPADNSLANLTAAAAIPPAAMSSTERRDGCCGSARGSRPVRLMESNEQRCLLVHYRPTEDLSTGRRRSELDPCHRERANFLNLLLQAA